MFVRTERLTLRPVWPEDAPALARAIGHEEVVRNLSHAPWPYALGDAEAFIDLRQRSGDETIFFLICAREGSAAPIVGGMGIHPEPGGAHELGYWLTPPAWGRGYATEAGRAVLRTARDTIRLRRLIACHFVDNPASGRVLRKLGFRPTGKIELQPSRARATEVPCAKFECELDSARFGDDPDARMAARPRCARGHRRISFDLASGWGCIEPAHSIRRPLLTTAAPSPAPAAWRDLLREGRAPVLALILLGDWLVAADALVTATILPSVGKSLAGYAWFGWTASAFLTGTVVAGASAGWLSERIGLRAAMVLAGVVLTIGCTLSAAAPDMLWFMAGRVLQGVAGGWVLGLVYVAMATAFPQAALPRLFALANSVWGVATVIGPLIGGLFADAGLWRGVFWLFAAQALVFALATLRLIPREARDQAHQRVPAGPLALLALAIAAVSAAGVVASTALAAGLLGGGLALLVVAVRSDMRAASGVLPPQVRDRASPLRAAYIVYFATNAAGIAFSLYGPALLRATLGLGGLASGYVVAIEAVAWTTLSIAVSGAGERWRTRWLVIGPASILAGVVLQGLVLGTGSLPLILLAGALLGGGFGVSYGFLGQRTLALFAPEEKTRGSGAIAAVRGAGGALGAAMASIGANAAGFGAPGGGDAHMIALAAFGSVAPFALWGLIAAVRVVRPRAYAGSTAA